ncbi:unnamed protein product [Amoebophrya sp. A120]|nr:unnamed protein product [Amoebophrya sp. A120]|eukprot:GSA120T00016473001.1
MKSILVASTLLSSIEAFKIQNQRVSGIEGSGPLQSVQLSLHVNARKSPTGDIKKAIALLQRDDKKFKVDHKDAEKDEEAASDEDTEAALLQEDAETDLSAFQDPNSTAAGNSTGTTAGNTTAAAGDDSSSLQTLINDVITKTFGDHFGPNGVTIDVVCDPMTGDQQGYQCTVQVTGFGIDASKFSDASMATLRDNLEKALQSNSALASTNVSPIVVASSGDEATTAAPAAAADANATTAAPDAGNATATGNGTMLLQEEGEEDEGEMAYY